MEKLRFGFGDIIFKSHAWISLPKNIFRREKYEINFSKS